MLTNRPAGAAMRHLAPVGRLFFALATLGLGIEHFVFQHFVTGRAPAWPDALPGRLISAYGSGVVVIAMGLAILAGRRGRLAAAVGGAFIAVWTLPPHLMVVAESDVLAATWTAAGKALTLFGGAFAIAGTLPFEERGPAWLLAAVNRTGGFIRLGRVCLGIFLVMTGIQHFMYTTFVASLIPAWFPGNAIWWTWFAGVALIAGGLGLQVPATARLAALLSGVMVFSWFWIVHLPRTFGGISDSIAVFEALAVSGIALVIAGYLPEAHGRAEAAAPRLAEAAGSRDPQPAR